MKSTTRAILYLLLVMIVPPVSAQLENKTRTAESNHSADFSSKARLVVLNNDPEQRINAWYPKFSPDGRQVVFVGGPSTEKTAFYSVSSDGGAPIKLGNYRMLGDRSLNFQFSPDSKYLVYVEGAKGEAFDQAGDVKLGLYSVPVSGGSPTSLWSTEDGTVSNKFQFSPDRQHIIISAKLSAFGKYRLYRIPIAGGDAIALVDGSSLPGSYGSILNETPGNDGADIVFLSTPYSPNPRQIYRVPITGGKAVGLVGEKLLQSSRGVMLNFSVSESSNVVAFGLGKKHDYASYLASQQDSSPTTDNKDYYSIRTDHSGRSQLQYLVSDDLLFMQLSPDGKYLIYGARIGSSWRYELFSVPTSGGTPKKFGDGLSLAIQADAVSMTSDSRHVIFKASVGKEGPQALFAASIEGGPVRRLRPPLTPLSTIASYIPSPDDRHVVALVDIKELNLSDLFSFPINGDPIRKLTTLQPDKENLGVRPKFILSADGREVYFIADLQTPGKMELFSARTSTGSTTKLNPDLPAGTDVHWLSGLQLNADGSRLLYITRNATSNKLVLNNLKLNTVVD